MEKKLIEKGYNPINNSINKLCTSAFQKRITDKDGIKYFINCFIYKDLLPETKYEFEVCVNTEFGVIRSQTIQWFFEKNEYYPTANIINVEDSFDKIWKSLGEYYYEKYEI